MLKRADVLEINLFGGLRVQRGETVITRFRTRQAAALLAYLAYFPQPHSREALVERFWPDTTFEKGRNNLRVALTSLRHQLEWPDLPGGTFITANHSWVQLQAAAVQTDVRAFEEALHRAAQVADENGTGLSKALTLYTGSLLPGFYDDWIPLEESRLEDLFIEASRQLLAHYIARGAIKEARQTAHYAACMAPRREEGPQWVENLKTQTRLPNQQSHAALRVKSQNNNSDLPLISNRFFGRESEMNSVDLLLHTLETRLVTLNGPGGCGKTRLALEIARRSANAPNSFQNPVFFVPLADVSQATFLRDAIATALPLSTARDEMAGDKSNEFERAIRWLRQFPSCLLILDNLEHLLPEATDVVQQIIDEVPALRCLATSRQSLNLPDERIITIGPLPVPATGDDDIDHLRALPAVQLFIDRAQARRPDFEITPHNASALAALVRRLKGIPIALELCAAQSRVLSPRQILLQIETEFDADAGPDRLGLRHDSVRATFEWSYRLLTPPLQQVFRALAVFRGGFSTEAVSAVCQENLVLPALAFLRDAALVQSAEIVVSPGHSEMRFTLLETVRAFADTLLPHEERPLVAARHAAYYLDLAEQIKAAPKNSWPGWQDVLEREQDNFWGALQWCNNHWHLGAARLAMALHEYWISYQPARGSQAFATLADQIRPGALQVDIAFQAALLCRAGEHELRLRHLPQANNLLQDSLTRARAAFNAEIQIKALCAIGVMELEAGDLDKAQQSFQPALVLARQHDDSANIAWLLRHIAAIRRAQGAWPEAHQLLNEALELFQKSGNVSGAAWMQLNLAGVFAAQENWADARPLCQAALDYFRRDGQKNGLMWTLHQRGEIARHFNEKNARELLEESLLLARHLENKNAIELCRKSLEALNRNS